MAVIHNVQEKKTREFKAKAALHACLNLGCHGAAIPSEVFPPWPSFPKGKPINREGPQPTWAAGGGSW
ncbi:MAG: hypothetical protein JWR26_2855 [Pedosphaera sp.]|nr:hypothetical protein [Pedosphaera sp.]